eukprot:7533135-Pyramimonas_sp.AAC.1
MFGCYPGEPADLLPQDRRRDALLSAAGEVPHTGMDASLAAAPQATAGTEDGGAVGEGTPL